MKRTLESIQQEQFELNEKPVDSARASSKPAKSGEPAPAKAASAQQQILVMHLMAPKGEVLSGRQLQEASS